MDELSVHEGRERIDAPPADRLVNRRVWTFLAEDHYAPLDAFVADRWGVQLEVHVARRQQWTLHLVRKTVRHFDNLLPHDLQNDVTKTAPHYIQLETTHLRFMRIVAIQRFSKNLAWGGCRYNHYLPVARWRSSSHSSRSRRSHRSHSCAEHSCWRY